jgi:hypothetical protein
MPGTYDVTLTVKASCTNTSDVCARYVEDVDDAKKFYIYVEEIPPRCNEGIYGSLSATEGYTNSASGISGDSPLTVYFNASSIIAGSFPIGRIDWDFGDGDVQRIVRYPQTITTAQGLSVINISAYPYDLNDPRNVVVPHIYTNIATTNQSYNINISAYASNTNTSVQCTNLGLVNPVVPLSEQDTIDTKRLIGSRFDENGNIVYTIQGQDKNTIYTVALSGELNNE